MSHMFFLIFPKKKPELARNGNVVKPYFNWSTVLIKLIAVYLPKVNLTYRS